MTAALEVGEWSAARQGRALPLPPERPGTHCTEGLVDGRKISSPPGFDPGLSSP